MSADDVHEGWCLLQDSWMFHRWFFHVYGRPTERGQYSYLLRQMRGKRDPEVIVAGVYRLKMPDGSPILVTARRGAMARLQTVLPPDWQVGDPVPWQRNPKRLAVKPQPTPTRVEPPVPVSQPAPVAAPPVPVAKPQRKPTTLSLGGKNCEVAETLLEYRKRRWG